MSNLQKRIAATQPQLQARWGAGIAAIAIVVSFWISFILRALIGIDEVISYGLGLSAALIIIIVGHERLYRKILGDALETASSVEIADYENFLIAEEGDGIYRVALYVQTAGPEYLELSTVVTPPITANAIVRLGKDKYSSSFDSTGRATIRIPKGLLISAFSSVIDIRIEPLTEAVGKAIVPNLKVANLRLVLEAASKGIR